MKRRLSVENRMLIEQLLRLNYKLKDIAYYVDSTSSTVSREIKNRRITGKGDFKECNKTKRFPYVCNGCNIKTYCRKKKYYYNYIKAQKNYNYLLEKSRIGIDMSIDEIDYWNDYFKDKIKNAIDCLRQINLDNIDTIIIDLRGNFGGNASLNKYLIDFLKENADKKLFVLTDYRVFSGGRYALRDLINLGAVTIGDEISTPINCYGNCYLEKINKYWTFTISEHYYHPMLNISFKSKEEYQNGITPEISKDYIFHPNILVKETIKDFINNNDPVLQKALELAAKKSKHI